MLASCSLPWEGILKLTLTGLGIIISVLVNQVSTLSAVLFLFFHVICSAPHSLSYNPFFHLNVRTLLMSSSNCA